MRRRKALKIASYGLIGFASSLQAANPKLETIAQLRDRAAATNPEQIDIAGYYASGDGGGGTFYADLKDTQTPDDGGTVIVPKSGGARWKRSIPASSTSKNNVKWFGARGNGVNNDSAAIANAVKASRNKTLEFPAGNYIGSLAINVSGIKVVGIGNVTIGSIIGEALTVAPSIGAINVAPFLGWSDKSDVKGLKRLVLSSDAQVGTSVLKLVDASAINVGDWVVLIQGSAEASNPTNHIPRDYQFLKITAKTGNDLTIHTKTDATYLKNQPHTRLLKWGELVVDSGVENITFQNLNGSAYLHSISGSVNFLVKNCAFGGISAMGASCFNFNLIYQSCRGYNLFSGLSCARGTESVLYEDCTIAIREQNPTEYTVGFFEESAKSIEINRCNFTHGMVFCIQLQNPLSKFLISNTTITNKYGAGILFQFCYGKSILIDNCQIIAAGKNLPKVDKAVIGQRYGLVVKVNNSQITALQEDSYPAAYDNTTATGVYFTNVTTNRAVPVKIR